MKIARLSGCCTGFAARPIETDDKPIFEPEADPQIPIFREDPYVSDKPDLTVEEIVKLREEQGQDGPQSTPWTPTPTPPIVPEKKGGTTGILAALGAGLWFLLG